MIEKTKELARIFAKQDPKGQLGYFFFALRTGDWASRETFEDFLIEAEQTEQRPPLRARMIPGGDGELLYYTPPILDPVKPNRELKYFDCAYTLRAARTTRGESEYYTLAAADPDDFPDLFRLKDPAHGCAWIPALEELDGYVSSYLAGANRDEDEVITFFDASVEMLSVGLKATIAFYKAINIDEYLGALPSLEVQRNGIPF